MTGASSDTKERLRAFADRLDWVYPLERSDALLEVIGPLFLREAAPTELQPPEPADAALHRTDPR